MYLAMRYWYLSAPQYSVFFIQCERQLWNVLNITPSVQNARRGLFRFLKVLYFLPPLTVTSVILFKWQLIFSLTNTNFSWILSTANIVAWYYLKATTYGSLKFEKSAIEYRSCHGIFVMFQTYDFYILPLSK